VDASRAVLLRHVLESTPWVDRTRSFARSLRSSTRHPGGLLLVGTPQEEPWHLAAHLDDESRLSDIPELAPTLVRWAPPPGAPAHLAVGLDRLEAARRGETLFVVAPEAAPEALLERVSDAKRLGATVLSLDAGDAELAGLAHDALSVPPGGLLVPRSGLEVDEPELLDAAVSLDVVSHLVSVAAAEPLQSATVPARRRGFRDRLARVLDTVSGPAPRR
jgi:hypothetical protein